MGEVFNDAEFLARRHGGAHRAGFKGADIRRAKLKPFRRIHPHGIEEFAIDEFSTRDEGLRRFDIALHQPHPIAWRGEGVRVRRDFRYRFAECGRAQNQLHAKPLAGAVMLQDDRKAEPFRRRCKMLCPHHGNGRRRWDIETRQRGILRNLGEFQLQGTPPIHHGPAMAFQMLNHRPRIFRRIGMPARVG